MMQTGEPSSDAVEVAIAMAQSEIDEGANPDAIELTQAIVNAQTEEITLMRDILDSL